jgi:hypothetical protein
VFLSAAPFALLGLLLVAFVKEVPLRSHSGLQAAAAAAVVPAPVPEDAKTEG